MRLSNTVTTRRASTARIGSPLSTDSGEITSATEEMTGSSSPTNAFASAITASKTGTAMPLDLLFLVLMNDLIKHRL